MTQVWFGSDFHFGHKHIERFRIEVRSCEHNQERISDEWSSCVGKRDHVYLLGDIAFTMEALALVKALPGAAKFLVRGNHDKLDTTNYLKTFRQVYGLLKYKDFWLSHCPIHPDELRGRNNLHGHVHYQSVKDERYFNCCPEALWPKYNRALVSLDELRTHYD